MDIKVKDIIKLGIAMIFFVYLASILVIPIVLIFNLDLESIDYQTLTFIDMSISLIQCVIVVTLFHDLLRDDFRAHFVPLETSRITKFLEEVIIGFVLFMVVKMLGAYISNIIAYIVGVTDLTTDNQSAIELLTGSAPAMMIISTVVLAPILEETIFRGAIRKVMKNKKVFITVSGLLFGLMHVIDSVTFYVELLVLGIVISYLLERKDKKRYYNVVLASIAIMALFAIFYYFQYGNLLLAIKGLDISELVGGITYVVAGIYLAYIYVKKDSICLNIGIHSLNNLLSMILILFYN